jgi:adenylosuccinate lyase
MRRFISRLTAVQAKLKLALATADDYGTYCVAMDREVCDKLDIATHPITDSLWVIRVYIAGYFSALRKYI